MFIIICTGVIAAVFGLCVVLAYFIRSSHHLQNEREQRKFQLDIERARNTVTPDPFQVDIAKLTQNAETERHQMSIMAEKAYIEDRVEAAKYEYWGRQADLAKEALTHFDEFRKSYPNINGEEFMDLIHQQLAAEPPIGRSFESPVS